MWWIYYYYYSTIYIYTILKKRHSISFSLSLSVSLSVIFSLMHNNVNMSPLYSYQTKKICLLFTEATLPGTAKKISSTRREIISTVSNIFILLNVVYTPGIKPPGLPGLHNHSPKLILESD